MSGLIRIIGHWTAGTYTVSDHDKESYHFIIDGEGRVVAGDLPPEANISVSDADGYAAHTRGCNTGAIGVSIAAMGQAIESPFSAGPWPIKAVQWSAFVGKIASLCKQYSIQVTPQTVLTHAEVQSTLGIQQAGKWDIARLPFEPSVIGAKAVGDKLRREVSAAIATQATGGIVFPAAVTGGIGSPPPQPSPYVTRAELAAMFDKFADELRLKK